MDTIEIKFTFMPSSLPVGVALDFYGSGNENKTNAVKTKTAFGGINLGLRWQGPVLADSIIPNFGGGISFVAAELQTVNSGIKTIYEDDSIGYWVGSGVDYIIAKQWSIGIDAHYSSVDLTLNGEVRDAGGLMWGATVGYHF